MSSVIKDPGSSGPSGTTQLVATLFAKSKPAGDTSADITPTDGRQQNVSSIPPRCPSELTTVLNTLVAPYTIQLQSALPLSPRVHQLIYTTTSPGFPPDLRNLPQLTSFERTHSLEIVLQYLPSPSDAPSTTHRTLKLAVFDLDSTLIDQEVIDELARTISITPLVAAITARAMAGELDFSASLRERVALLKGVRADVWDQLKQVVTFAEGARELCRALRRLDVKMAVLSGGFVEMAEWVKGQLGLDYVHANHVCSLVDTYHSALLSHGKRFLVVVLHIICSAIATGLDPSLLVVETEDETKTQY